jgi:5-methylcytosine-specific restriction endonuclease McrA
MTPDQHLSRKQEARKRYYHKHKEQARLVYKAWYDQNLAKVEANAHKWNDDHPERRRVLRRYVKARLRAGGGPPAWVFDRVLAYDCLYCGRPSVGVDRFEPGGPYRVGNMVPACKPCNSNKNSGEPREWVLTKYGQDALDSVLQFLEDQRAWTAK